MTQPLAYKARPQNFDQMVGQEHLIGPQGILRQMVSKNKIPSIILYGPPGTGKTTLAEIIANESNHHFVAINATTSNKKAMEEVPKDSNTILFIDEIHRFNKAQQDYLLPFVEKGEVILIGATTENPYFEVNTALLSRMVVYELKPLEGEDIKKLIQNTLKELHPQLRISSQALVYLVGLSGPDARRALNLLEMAYQLTTDTNNPRIELSHVKSLTQRPLAQYDKNGDKHYDTVSAFIKSMRGSDPDAALYYLAKMLDAGEDPKFIARRIMISASEDVGNANPEALVLATAASLATERIGLPEARIILAQAAVYNAMSPKSNSAYIGINKALEIAKNTQYSIPDHLKDAHYKGAKNLGHGIDYIYPHDYPKAYHPQTYLPKELESTTFWESKGLGREDYLLKYQQWAKNQKTPKT